MSDLTTRRFLKMNGLGNQITVLDLRGSTARVTAAEARAIAADPRSHFEQLMVLHDPQTPGTDAFMRIYNTDGTQIRGLRQRHALRRMGDANDPAMRTATSEVLVLETAFGLLPVRRLSDLIFTVDMGEPRFNWSDIPLARPFADTRAIAVEPVPRRAGAGNSFGGEHGQSPRDLLGRMSRPTTWRGSGRSSKTTRSFRSAPISRSAQ